MPKILVTGGAGFIGSNLANRLTADAGSFVVAADNLLTGNRHYLNKSANLEFINCDVNQKNVLRKVFQKHRFDFVYHYAAVVGVQRTLQNPVMVLRDIEGIKNILDCCRDSDVRRIFFSSSSEVYGEPVEMPQHEDRTPLNSRLPYAVVKNVGESFLRSYKQEYGLDFTIFRFFNTYGPHQSADFVMSRFIKVALKGRDITVYGDGRQTRTFCYVDDNVEATIKALKAPDTIGEVINIGNDREITIKDLAEKVLAVTGSNSRVVHLPPLKEGDMTRRRPDVTKMKKLLGREFTPLDKGMKQLVGHMRAAA